MYYLNDVAIFTLLLIALILHGWSTADARQTKLESTLIGGTRLLGSFALIIWGATSIVPAQSGARGPQVLLIGFQGLCVALIGGIISRPRQLTLCAASAGRSLLRMGLVEKLLATYLFIVFLLTFVLNLAPPNGNDYDSLVYHLAAPQQYLRAGHIVELSYDHHSYFPFTMEMLYMLGLWLKGPVLAKLFHWLMLPISCLALVAIGQRHLSLRAGLLGAALFASIPVVQSEASTAYIDLGLTAFSLLAFLCFANWLTSRDRYWLGYCGVFCGFCLGTKYLGVLTFGWLGLWALGSMAKRRDWNVAALAFFAGWALLFGTGWYLRNWLWTGNPVYPFAYELFGGRGWSAEMAKAYTADQAAYGFGHSISDWLWLPWRVAATPLNVVLFTPSGPAIYPRPYWPLAAVTVTNGSLGRFEVAGHILQTVIGPALLAFGAPLLFMRRKPLVVGFVLWSFLFFWVFWAATSQQLRYLIPAFGILSLACGWGAQEYLRRSRMLKWTAAATLAGWLLFAPAYTAWSGRRNLPVVTGRATPEQFLDRTFSGYAAMNWASTQTPEKARFAVYGEPRCFYLKRDYFWADDPHNNLIDYSRVKNGADLVRELNGLGATHVLWNEGPVRGIVNGGVFGPPPQFEQAVEQGLIQPIFEANAYRVYEIVKQGGAAR